MDAVRRHSQSTWPVSMRPLNAGTKEEMMTGKTVRSCTTQKKKRQAEKAPPTPSPWPATPHQPSHTHAPSQCRQSAGERIRPSIQKTHTLPAATHRWTRTRRDTAPLPPVQSHDQRDTATARSQHTAHTKRAISHPPTRGSGALIHQ
ncbi:exo-alpha-sialidase [Trypanosoma cruzi]|nr:exo-alpha-sialidase [Trypanosoma cruzi]